MDNNKEINKANQDEVNQKKINELEESELYAASNEETDLFYDFDKAIEETKTKELKIMFNNKYYYVPSEMPFSFSMFFFRNCMKKADGKDVFEVPESQLGEFIELMFGSEFLKSLETNKKLTINQVFSTLALKILKKWGYAINVTDAKGQTVQKKI